MIVRFLKSYQTEHKALPRGKVTRRKRKEAQMLIENKIAEEYKGPFPPKLMKTDLFKPKN